MRTIGKGACLALFVLSFASAAAADKMYWLQYFLDTSSIKKANLDGTGVQFVPTGGMGQGGPTAFAVDQTGGKVYFCFVHSAPKLQRVDLDGSNLEDLILSLADYAEDMALDFSRGSIYWTDFDEIRRAGQDGSGMQVLLGGLESPRGLSLDVENGRMYWVEEAPARLRRANLDGSAVEDLILLSANGRDTALASDLGKIYWIQSDGTLRRADLDGGNPATLPVALDGPAGIAFDPLSARIYLVDNEFDGENTLGRILSTNADGGDLVMLLSEIGNGFAHISLDTPLGGGVPVPALSYAGLAALMLALLAAAAFVARRRRPGLP